MKMTKEEILNDNNVIATFMGLPKLNGHTHTFTINAGESNWYNTEPKYHESWDWLMPVIQKINDTQQHEAAIRDLQYTIQYLLSGGYGFTEYSRKKATLTLQTLWERAVIFIKWYNDQKKK